MTTSSTGEEPLDRGQLQQRAVRGAMWTGIHTLVSLPLAFGVNILLARVLGVADYGRLAYLTTIITIASVIAGLGVTTALLQFGAKAHAAGRTKDVRRYLSGAQGFGLLVTGPIVAVAVVLTVRVDPWLLIVALIFGVGAPAMFSTSKAALTIENRTDRAAQLTIVGNVVKQVAVVAAILVVGTADAVWSARVIAGGILLGLPLLSIAPRYRGAVLRPRGPWTLPQSFWRFALPAGAAGIAGTLATNRTEIILLEIFADPVAMGLYGLAFGLAGHVYAPAQAFIGPLVPAVSALSEVDQMSVRRAFLRTSRAGSAIGGLLVAAALPALACLVPVIYGPDFAGASDLLVVIGIGSAVALIGSPHHAFLMARMKGGRLLGISLVGLAVATVMALALIPFLGAWGAAIGCTVGMFVRTAQLTLGEARALDVGFADLAGSLGAMGVGSLVAVVVWLVARVSPGSELLLASLALLLGSLAYVVGVKVMRTGLTQGDVDAIAGALPSRIKVISRVMLSCVRGAGLARRN